MLNCADWELWLGRLRGVQREQEERVVGAWWGQERDFLGEDREG